MHWKKTKVIWSITTDYFFCDFFRRVCAESLNKLQNYNGHPLINPGLQGIQLGYKGYPT